MSTQRSRAALVALAAGVALAGCSGSNGSGPQALPSITASPTGTASAAPEVPPLPEAAEANTADAAVALARYYVDVLNLSYAGTDYTASTMILRTLSDPACTACERYLDTFDSTWGSGGRVEGSQMTVKDIYALTQPSDADQIVLARLDSTAYQAYDKDGQLLEHSGAESDYVAQFQMHREGERWLVRSIKAVSK